MDVDKTSFYPLLPDILTDISTAHFVTIDLELSGIPTKDPAAGKPTLQQRYLETKEAAERYQILQIGLTCVEQDVENNKYILKPYNFDLSPIINERGLDVERIFSFQSGAAEFLLKVGFDIGRPFTHGVPYLNREESKTARDKHTKRNDKNSMADIFIKPTEIESLAFLSRVRNEITNWQNSTNMDTPEFLNINPLIPASEIGSTTVPSELSRFEKRLVHQLVRAEFPTLTSISRRGFIQLVHFDKSREDRIAEGRRRGLEESIARQKGFRWIIDALSGQNISSLDLRECAKDSVTGEPIYVDLDEYKSQFNRAQRILRNNPKVLVGHNCFLDLVYVYRTFVGELPDTVEEFQQKLHELWPVIVDTKYMSTHNCGDISPASSLEQIAEQLSRIERPVVETDGEHGKYTDVEAFHEAGYDSFLTAQILVRLSAKLEGEGEYVDAVEEGVAGLRLGEVEGGDGQVEEEGFTPSEVNGRWRDHGDATVGKGRAGDPFVYETGVREHRGVDRRGEKMVGGMPRFGSDFWRVYGNRLRVFGTQEGVCVLDGGGVEPTATATGSDEDGGVNL